MWKAEEGEPGSSLESSSTQETRSQEPTTRQRGAHGIPGRKILRAWRRELGDQWNLGKDLGRGQVPETLRGHSILDTGLKGDGTDFEERVGGVEEMDSRNESVKKRSDVGGRAEAGGQQICLKSQGLEKGATVESKFLKKWV